MTDNAEYKEVEKEEIKEALACEKEEPKQPKKSKGSVYIIAILLLSVALLLESMAIFRLSSAENNEAITKETSETKIETIDRTGFDELCAKKQSFIVMFGRVSCKQCAVVEYVLDNIKDSPIPIYKFDMEKCYGTDEYDAIKNEVGINYVPTLFYYEDGEQKYCKNNPLPDGYYDSEQTAEGRHALRVTTRENIEAFINGAIGKGEVINEIPTSDTLVAKEVPADAKAGD